MGEDTPYWFVTQVHVNNFTELAEFYSDFSGISCVTYSTEGIQDLVNLSDLTYLQLYISGTSKEKKEFEEHHLEELNILLPDCEIHLD